MQVWSKSKIRPNYHCVFQDTNSDDDDNDDDDITDDEDDMETGNNTTPRGARKRKQLLKSGRTDRGSGGSRNLTSPTSSPR